MATKKSSKKTATSELDFTPIEAITHDQNTRPTIPTQEQEELASVVVGEDEPQELLYPRDTSLDPQLVWKGKDEQDRKGLKVEVRPIFIQERIQPKALIESFRAELNSPEDKPQMPLFDQGFAGPSKPEDKLDFYNHQEGWTNRMILGDSLLAMTSLLEKEGFRGKVQMIYMDPPYGIKFGSNWQVSTRKREVKDGNEEHVSFQPEQIKAFRDTWELGIHSYLSYLRERLTISRELLADSGSIFVQIGDENVHLVRALIDEIFGSENFMANIAFRTKIPLGTKFLAGVADYVIWYAKSIDSVKFRRLFVEREVGGESQFSSIEDEDFSRRRMSEAELLGNIKKSLRPFRITDLVSAGRTESCVFEFAMNGKSFFPSGGKSWKTNFAGMQRLIKSNRLEAPAKMPGYVFFQADYPVQEFSNLWTDTQGASDRTYVVQTSDKIIQRCLLMSTDPGDIVLDPTCGSGTTAFVAEQWGRRWITMDTSRVAVALARMRLMGAKYPYYLLADSEEGQKKLQVLSGKRSAEEKTSGDICQGFVYERVPHITLGAIANNEEIDTIHAEHEKTLVPLRERLNSLLKKSWEEWEVPREAESGWPAEAKETLTSFWKQRRARQKEIDDSIARRAEYETLYDRPYEDPKRVRVSGPFTVESLSPHRTIQAEKNGPTSRKAEAKQLDFVTVVLEHLKRYPVQNTLKNERLELHRVASFAGQWLQGEGWQRPDGGDERRVALSVGPEHGTVGLEQVRKAAEEASGAGNFSLLVVLGFAFDAHASEEARKWGPRENAKKQEQGLTVLLARINPDMAMAKDLKQTGAGNLFMVFGEPDVELRKLGDGKFQVEVKGVDVYDPNTRELRSQGVEGIACWFIDTDYSGDSFFVRQAYFTGDNDPYEKLKKALKADIREDAWESMYGTESRPFSAPRSGMIAVKVINHYGDEVMKVFSI